MLLPGFAVYTLSALRQAYTSAKQRTQAAVEPLRSVAVGEGGLTFLKIAFADKVVIASGPALQGGIGVWRLKSLVDGTSVSQVEQAKRLQFDRSNTFLLRLRPCMSFQLHPARPSSMSFQIPATAPNCSHFYTKMGR